MGYAPELWGCVECGGVDELCFFSPSEGGIVCRSCGAIPDTQILTPDTLTAMRYVQDADNKKAFAFSLAKSNISEFEALTEKMLENIIGYKLQSLNYLKQIAGRI